MRKKTFKIIDRAQKSYNRSNDNKTSSKIIIPDIQNRVVNLLDDRIKNKTFLIMIPFELVSFSCGAIHFTNFVAIKDEVVKAEVKQIKGFNNIEISISKLPFQDFDEACIDKTFDNQRQNERMATVRDFYEKIANEHNVKLVDYYLFHKIYFGKKHRIYGYWNIKENLIDVYFLDPHHLLGTHPDLAKERYSSENLHGCNLCISKI